MNLGNQVEWALHCMTVLAGMPAGTKVSAKLLAEFHDVPKEYLSKSLQLLSNAGLVLGLILFPPTPKLYFIGSKNL